MDTLGEIPHRVKQMTTFLWAWLSMVYVTEKKESDRKRKWKQENKKMEGEPLAVICLTSVKTSNSGVEIILCLNLGDIHNTCLPIPAYKRDIKKCGDWKQSSFKYHASTYSQFNLSRLLTLRHGCTKYSKEKKLWTGNSYPNRKDKKIK